MRAETPQLNDFVKIPTLNTTVMRTESYINLREGTWESGTSRTIFSLYALP